MARRPVLIYGLATVGLAFAVWLGDRLLLPPIVEGNVHLGGDLPNFDGSPQTCSYRGTTLMVDLPSEPGLRLVVDRGLLRLEDPTGKTVWKGRPTCTSAAMTSDPDSQHGEGEIHYACEGDPVSIGLRLRRCDRKWF